MNIRPLLALACTLALASSAAARHSLALRSLRRGAGDRAAARRGLIDDLLGVGQVPAVSVPPSAVTNATGASAASPAIGEAVSATVGTAATGVGSGVSVALGTQTASAAGIPTALPGHKTMTGQPVGNSSSVWGGAKGSPLANNFTIGMNSTRLPLLSSNATNLPMSYSTPLPSSSPQALSPSADQALSTSYLIVDASAATGPAIAPAAATSTSLVVVSDPDGSRRTSTRVTVVIATQAAGSAGTTEGETSTSGASALRKGVGMGAGAAGGIAAVVGGGWLVLLV